MPTPLRRSSVLSARNTDWSVLGAQNAADWPMVPIYWLCPIEIYTAFKAS